MACLLCSSSHISLSVLKGAPRRAGPSSLVSEFIWNGSTGRFPLTGFRNSGEFSAFSKSCKAKEAMESSIVKSVQLFVKPSMTLKSLFCYFRQEYSAISTSPS
ncbi:hypothetical protein MLD38_001614 [Melastoma candidum]|uniref:Uncharacterized protein n=1 Tax=Melastoma candidum TaxID=119954 RepID=A0ACB9SDT9_9MYRT|nr:hypothetical protein MLD38_001614 [Melastoma candidum]